MCRDVHLSSTIHPCPPTIHSYKLDLPVFPVDRSKRPTIVHNSTVMQVTYLPKGRKGMFIPFKFVKQVDFANLIQLTQVNPSTKSRILDNSTLCIAGCLFHVGNTMFIKQKHKITVNNSSKSTLVYSINSLTCPKCRVTQHNLS